MQGQAEAVGGIKMTGNPINAAEVYVPIVEPECMPEVAPERGRSRAVYGTGEMAERIRGFDWSRTAVGPMEAWPDVLLTTVNMMLGSAHPMFLWWGEELVQFYNDAYRPTIGSDKHPSALGQRAEECWPETWEVVGPQIHRVMRTGASTWNENHLVPIYREGRLTDVYWTYGYSPVWDVDGSVRGVLVVCSDTTASVKAEAELRAERARLLSILQQAPVFFTLLEGPEHTIRMVNPLYMKLVNHRPVLGKPVREALPEAVEQGFLEILDGVYAGQRYVASEMVYKAYAGEGEPLEERYLDFIYEPLREKDGRVSGVLVLGLDVTERKEAHEALVRTEKLAAVGRLAASIAHEINNPLEAVTNLLYLARQEEEQESLRTYLMTAEEELQRVSAITNQTLSFQRQSSETRAVTGVELFSDVLRIYQGKLANSNVRVQRRNRAERGVTCFAGEVRQVLSNLVGNAMDSMQPAGGSLYLRSREGTEWRTGRRGVVLTVADEGRGMSPQVAEKVFEPFFTTKGASGSGLGLWISKEIVDRHQGAMRVRSRRRCEDGQRGGTVFTMFLPFEAELRARVV